MTLSGVGEMERESETQGTDVQCCNTSAFWRWAVVTAKRARASHCRPLHLTVVTIVRFVLRMFYHN